MFVEYRVSSISFVQIKAFSGFFCFFCFFFFFKYEISTCIRDECSSYVFTYVFMNDFYMCLFVPLIKCWQ
jgi:hypothetical protein